MADKATTPSGLTFAPLNPAGLSAEEMGGYTQNLSDATEALAHRYDNPNWFNVAAGFFKPQLGGFAASLGSASQALGENIEQQRANIAPVAQMRAEIGRMGVLQKQKEMANQLVGTLKPGEPVPPDIKGKVAQLDPGGPAEAAVNAINAEYTRLQEQKASQVNAAAAQGRAQTELPSDIYKGVNLDLSNPNAAPPDTAALKNKLVAAASTIPGMDADKLKTMNIDQLQDTLYSNEKEKREFAFKDKATAGAAIDATNRDLRQLGEIRAAVDRPGMDRVLGTTTGSDALSAIATFYKMQNLDTAKAMSQALAQVKLKDPEAFDDFQVLVKKLNENVALARSVLTNPSDTSTGIIGSAKPSIENTQNAIRKMTDLTAHELSSQAQESMYRLGYAGNPTAIHLDPGYGTLQNNLSNQRFQLMSAPATAGVKPFYNIYGEFAKNTQPPKPDEVVQTVAKTKTPVAAAPAAAAPQSKRVTAADLRRAAGLE